MKFTGERMIPEYNLGKQIYVDHKTRYLFASQLAKNKIVLDVASGSGYGSEILLRTGKAKKVYGIDISKEAIVYSKNKYKSKNIEFLQGDCRNIPLNDKIADIVVSFETIEHIEEQEQFMKEIKRVIKKDGLLVISTPNKKISSGENEFHKKELNKDQFENLLKRYFKNINVFYQDIGFGSHIADSKSEGIEKNYWGFGIKEKKGIDSTYFIAMASNVALPEVNPVSLVSNSEEIDQKIQLITNLQNLVSLKSNELEEIKKSKAWNAVQKYRKIRNLIFHFRFLTLIYRLPLFIILGIFVFFFWAILILLMAFPIPRGGLK